MKKNLFHQLSILCLITFSIVSCHKETILQTDNKPTISKSTALRMGIPFQNQYTEHIGSWLITKTFYKNSLGFVQGCVIAVPDDYDTTTDMLPLIISEGGTGSTIPGGSIPANPNAPDFEFWRFSGDGTHIAKCLAGNFNKRAIVVSFQVCAKNDTAFRGFMLDDLLKYLYGIKVLPTAQSIGNVQPNQNITGLRINRDKVSMFLYSYSGGMRQFWTYNNPATGRSWAADFPIATPIAFIGSYNGVNDSQIEGAAKYNTMGYVVAANGADNNCNPVDGYYWSEYQFQNAIESIQGQPGSTTQAPQSLKTYCGPGHEGNDVFVNDFTDLALSYSRTTLGVPTANNYGEHIGSMYITKTFYKNVNGYAQGVVIAVPDNYYSTTDLLPLIISEGDRTSNPDAGVPFDFTKLINDQTHISQCLNGTFDKRAIVISLQDNMQDSDLSFRGYMLDDLLRYLYGLKPLPTSADINGIKANQKITGLRINKDKVSLWMYGFSGNMKQFWTYNSPSTGQPWSTNFPITTPLAAICSYNSLNDNEDNTGMKYKSMGYVYAGRGGGDAQNPSLCQPTTGNQWGLYNYETNFYNVVKNVENTTGSIVKGVQLQTNCGSGSKGNNLFLSAYTDQVLLKSRVGLGLQTAN